MERPLEDFRQQEPAWKLSGLHLAQARWSFSLRSTILPWFRRSPGQYHREAVRRGMAVANGTLADLFQLWLGCNKNQSPVIPADYEEFLNPFPETTRQHPEVFRLYSGQP